jgi:hypothetical protein
MIAQLDIFTGEPVTQPTQPKPNQEPAAQQRSLFTVEDAPLFTGKAQTVTLPDVSNLPVMRQDWRTGTNPNQATKKGQ